MPASGGWIVGLVSAIIINNPVIASTTPIKRTGMAYYYYDTRKGFVERIKKPFHGGAL